VKLTKRRAKKKKTEVTIKGKKAGKAKVQAKVGKKKYVCKVTVKNKTNKSSVATQKPTRKPVQTPAPTGKTSSQPTQKPEAKAVELLTQYDDAIVGGNAPISEGADDILGLFKKQQELRNAAKTQQNSNFVPSDGGQKEKEDPVKVLVDITKLFMFQNLTELSKLAAVLGGFYKGKNDLYEDVATHRYYLLVSKSSQSPEEFNKVCNILSEYGAQQAYSPATEAFFGEHYRLVIKGKALQMLAAL
jgi:hypothetical protein